MPRRALVDTGVLIGVALARDVHHAASRRIVAAAEAKKIGPLVVTDFVLAETLNYLVRKAGSPTARDVQARIASSPGMEITRTPEATYDLGSTQLFARHDGLSFVDALTAAYAQTHRIDTIYSFDGGFDRVPGLRRQADV